MTGPNFNGWTQVALCSETFAGTSISLYGDQRLEIKSLRLPYTGMSSPRGVGVSVALMALAHGPVTDWKLELQVAILESKSKEWDKEGVRKVS